MSKYILHGHIVPMRGDFNISPVTKTIDEINSKIFLICQRSKIVAECECNDPTVNISTIKNVVEELIRVILDSVGYSIAACIDVEIECAYNPDKQETSFFARNDLIFDQKAFEHILKTGKHPDLPIEPNQIAELSMKDLQLRIALGDFREAIRQPKFTAFHCHRSIETLKFSDLINNSEGDKLGQLRSLLKIKKTTLDKVTMADEQRHGKVTSHTAEQRKEQLQIAWQIIRRYILYKNDSESVKKLDLF